MGTECPVCTWGGVEEAETTAPAGVTLCHMLERQLLFLSKFLSYDFTNKDSKVKDWNENLLVQRGWGTTNWLIFLLYQHLKKDSSFSAIPNQNGQANSKYLPYTSVCFSIHLPDTSLFSMDTFYQLVDGFASWTHDFFFNHTISGFTVWSNVGNTN